MLDFIEDAPVQDFISKAVHTLVSSVDLSQSAGVILESMTRNGRHQELLDEGINQLAKLLHNEETQAFIAQGIVDWLKEEYAMFEKVLPKEAIGRKGADIAVRLAAGILAKVNDDPEHQLRKNFDQFTARLRRAPEKRSGVPAKGRGDQAVPARRRHPEHLPEIAVGRAEGAG